MWIVVDSMAVCHAAKHSIGNIGLKNDNMEVGVILGFLNRMSFLADKFQTNQFIFAWDSKNNHRYKLYPEYKAHRHSNDKTPEEIAFEEDCTNQFEEIRCKVLFEMGFRNVFLSYGYEADDLIANIVKSYVDDIFIIATVDSDLYQLLSGNTKVYNLRSKRILSDVTFEKEYLVTPEQWVDVKAMAGDSSDNINGIKGIAQARATRYINNELSPTSKAYRSLKSEESKKIIDRNRKLIKLPFEGTPLPILSKDEVLYERSFREVFEKYQFRSLLRSDVISQWIRRFDLQ